MSKTSDGAKLQPQFASSGNPPTFAADLTSLSDFFAARSFQQFATVAAVLAATSGRTADDVALATNAPGAWFRFDGSAWVMHGVPLFADSSARTTAISSPVAGMRSRLANGYLDDIYVNGAWRAGNIIASGTLSAVSSFNIDGLEGAGDYEVVIKLPTASTGNDLTIVLRDGTTPDTSANYDKQFVGGAVASAFAAGNMGQNSWASIASAGRARKTIVLRTLGLNVAEPTQILCTVSAYDATSNPNLAEGVLDHRLSAAYTGLGFAVSSGTVTGRYEVRAI